MSTFNYEVIEQLFAELLVCAQDVLSLSEVNEVREYLQVHEYGLALLTFVDIVTEEKKSVSKQAAAICTELAQRMGLSGEMDLAGFR